MNKLKGAVTLCTNCNYEALTWHEDLNQINPCRKCSGKLEIIISESYTKPSRLTRFSKDGGKG